MPRLTHVRPQTSGGLTKMLLTIRLAPDILEAHKIEQRGVVHDRGEREHDAAADDLGLLAVEVGNGPVQPVREPLAALEVVQDFLLARHGALPAWLMRSKTRYEEIAKRLY